MGEESEEQENQQEQHTAERNSTATRAELRGPGPRCSAERAPAHQLH